MELNFGQQPNSSSSLEPEPQYGNTVNWDFSNPFDFSDPTSFQAGTIGTAFTISPSTTELNFGQPNSSSSLEPEPQYGNTINLDFSNPSDFSGPKASFKAAMREANFLEAPMQPVDEESLRAPQKRKNVRFSKDPQTVVARKRRERIAHKVRVLKKMVPGGSKMDTEMILEETWHYAKFLERQLQLFQALQQVYYQPMIMGDDAFFPGGGAEL